MEGEHALAQTKRGIIAAAPGLGYSAGKLTMRSARRGL
ncbi:hypothetical protein OH686_09655 [Pseudomonas sp. SO81]|nr:hypothetical protein OH686_09655 [Pseudomonas sp. SO81]